MKKQFILGLVLSLLIALLTGCTGLTGTAGHSTELVILHTNDHHGVILPDNGTGGLAERAAFIKTVRTGSRNVLLLDAGDINSRGQGLSPLYDWHTDVDAYNIMGYEAMTFGNHEFDKGIPLLKEQMHRAKFPFLSANIKNPDGTYLGKPWIIKEYDGLRVGIFGLTTIYYNNDTGQIIFLDPVESAREAVRQLRGKEGCDIVIALVHLGLGEDGGSHSGTAEIAESVSGIDLIIDGHSETYLEEPFIINGVPVITAFHYGQYVGEAYITVTEGKILSFEWRPVVIDSNITPDPEISRLITPFKTGLEAIMNERLAVAADDFEQDFKESLHRETAAGNMINDATVWYLRENLNEKVDFAFTNGATLRAGPKKGEVTGRNVFDLIPFENSIMIAEMKGSDVTALFEFIASLPTGSRGWAQVSKEARYTIDYTQGGMLKDLTIGGRTISPEATYAVATNDFITRGGSGYKISGSVRDTGVNLRTALTEYIKYVKTLKPVTDGRIKVIENL